MTDQRTPSSRKPVRWPVYVLIIVLVVAAGCCGAYRWFTYTIDEKPPELTAEYTSSEALLVSEDLAGQLIAELPLDDNGISTFDSRSWGTATCTSGWNGYVTWEGFVSGTVGYDFNIHEDDEAQRIEYAQLIFDKLEELGLEPIQEPQGDNGFGVSAERDDGLWIRYSSDYGLSIGTGCVVQDNEVVYTPPHTRIPPRSDHQNLEEWPQSD